MRVRRWRMTRLLCKRESDMIQRRSNDDKGAIRRRSETDAMDDKDEIQFKNRLDEEDMGVFRRQA